MMQWHLLWQEASPWGTAVAVLGLRTEGEIWTMHGLKTWQSWPV